MKIIGVTGMSGAGKTTFSNFLSEKENVGVLHLDKVINDLKEEKFKKGTNRRNNRNEIMLFKAKTRYFINNNKMSFGIFMALKRKMIKKRIKTGIEKFKREGKDGVVIDSAYLTKMVDPEIFDSIIYIKRPASIRIRAVQERDGVSKEEIISRDLPYKNGLATSKETNFDYIIENNGEKEDLRKEGEKILDEVLGIKTFDERYVVKLGKITIPESSRKSLDNRGKGDRYMGEK